MRLDFCRRDNDAIRFTVVGCSGAKSSKAVEIEADGARLAYRVAKTLREALRDIAVADHKDATAYDRCLDDIVTQYLEMQVTSGR